MLFERRLRDGIRDSTISLAVRRWKRPQVVAGRRYRTGEGIVEVESIAEVGEASIDEGDARRAGYESVGELLAGLAGDPSLPIFLVALRRIDEPDPRSVLAADDRLDEGERARIDRRLARLDRSSPDGPWTDVVLRLIAARPAVRAPDLAKSLGRETAPFKLDVRKLKNLGLTESLRVGYRLSPRGEAYLRANSAAPTAPLADVPRRETVA